MSDLAERPANEALAALETQELYHRLARALTVTADGLYEAAAIWSELVRRGEAPVLRSGLLTWLPRIARRELAAEAVVAFAGQPTVLKQIIGMDLDRQRELARGQEVEIAIMAPDGEVRTERKPLARMTAREVVLALEAGSVRPIRDQIKRAQLKSSVPRALSSVAISADTRTNILVIGRARVRPGDLRDALAELGYRIIREK